MTDKIECCYSTNDEDYNHDSIEDCVESIIADMLYDDPYADPITIWWGEKRKFSASDLMPDIVDSMSQQAWDQVKEHAEDWPDCTHGQAEELNQLLSTVVEGWFIKYNVSPNFYQVLNTQPIKIKIQNEDGDYIVIHEGTT